ncbi:MAG: BamA/TamA family outer membrane protein [Flavobacteriales bacterium]|nr:BamA/TamA family outer membrane protein [Flavobacteriales bacterium]
MMRILALFLLLSTHHLAGAQRTLQLEASAPLPRWAKGPFKVADSTASVAKAMEVRQALIADGHLEASVDTCRFLPGSTVCTLHLGPTYRWARLRAGGVEPEIASSAGFRERFYADRPVRPAEVARLMEDLLDECERNGHPFATVRLDSLRQQEDGLEASIVLDRGRAVRVDSVVVKGTARMGDRFLWSQIGIRPGDPYNEEVVSNVDRRTRELPFVTARQPAYVLFSPEQTKLFLFLDARKASSVNGVLGVLPDANTGEVKFTGDLDLKLRNALKRGEAIDLNWRGLPDQTQDLKLHFNLPFVFNTPFGVDLGLKLFKRDSTFLEVNARAGLDYLLTRGDKVTGFVNSRSTDRLGRTTVPTPGLADISILSYGLGLRRERFDYRFNPREGLGLELEGSVGRKRSTTAVLGSTEPESEVQSVQYQADARVVWHVPVRRQGTLRWVVQGGWMVNDQLYTNELYRIGGLRTMRGVDEASIYCSAWAVGTAEYRFLFEENSNFLLFVDLGWWQDESQETPVSDDPLGFGVGTNFETRAGIFSLTYALGQQFGNPVDIRNGKVHFGFTSLF